MPRASMTTPFRVARVYAAGVYKGWGGFLEQFMRPQVEHLQKVAKISLTLLADPQKTPFIEIYSNKPLRDLQAFAFDCWDLLCSPIFGIVSFLICSRRVGYSARIPAVCSACS